jgi:hypothetical protein
VSYFKWAIFFAVFAFAVSAGLGFISGVSVPLVILRAIVFAVFFFGFGFAMRFLVTNYFPELFLPRDATESQYPLEQKPPVETMTIDTKGEYAVPELYKSSSSQNELGNIEDLISGAFRTGAESVDRMEEESYNGSGIRSEMEVKYDASAAGDQEIISFQDMFDGDTTVYDEPRYEKASKPDFTPSLGNDSEGLGGLPDLDSMAMAFGGMSSFPESPSSFGGDIESAPSGRTDVEPAESRYTGNKPQPLKGDFNPQELAKGISTVLAKEK